MPRKKAKVDEALLGELNKIPKPIPTIVNIILDQSGSMDAVRKATIDGFNEYLGTLKADKNDVRLSLTLFDTVAIEKPYVVEKLKNVKPLDEQSYQPRGGTPLYDAVVTTIKEAHQKLDKTFKKYASVVVIMTDGEENSSSEYNKTDFVKVKEELEKQGNWTFVFMGANQDAWMTAQQWGFNLGNTMTWDATTKGVQNAFRSLSDSTTVYASAMNAAAYGGGGGKGSAMLNTTRFFDNDDTLKKDD